MLVARSSDRPSSNQQGATSNLTEAIFEVVAAADPPVGRTRTVEILRGGRSKVVRRYDYDRLPGYGDFAEWRAEEVLAEVDGLIEAGRLQSTGGKFPKLRVVEQAA